jgi:hypothetical protein
VPSPLGAEIVDVAPATIRSPDLDVREALSRIHGFDQGFPLQGNSVQAKAVLDDEPRLDPRAERSQDPEMEKWRRERFQVARIGEELEDFLDGACDGLLPAESSLPGLENTRHVPLQVRPILALAAQALL